MFKKNINFVALNIDNTKWTDEVSQYRVRGVPHFVFLDGQGRQLAAAVGRVPQQASLSSAIIDHALEEKHVPTASCSPSIIP